MKQIKYGLGAELSPYDPNVCPVRTIIPMSDYPDEYYSPEFPVTSQGVVGRCVSEATCNCVEIIMHVS